MGRTWLLPFYDGASRLAGVRAVHERVVELASITAGQTVMDVGLLAVRQTYRCYPERA